VAALAWPAGVAAGLAALAALAAPQGQEARGGGGRADRADERRRGAELPAVTFVELADRLARRAATAEAIRERLRGMVRELIERGVLEHRPGWTVTELAAVAAGRRPAVAGR
jgi:hypothetical protein